MKTINVDEQKTEWNNLKDKLKRKYPQLTDQDLMSPRGADDELFARVQEVLGMDRQDILKSLEERPAITF